MNPKAAAAPLELAPDPALATEALYVVALTPTGQIPLRIDNRRGEPTPPVVRLPGRGGSRPVEPMPQAYRRLDAQAGLDADALVVMSRYGIPTGQRGRATILLAPRARVRTVSLPPGTTLVPLAELMSWLSARKAEGARIDARVWVGLLLAERHYPRWAQARLRAAVEELRRREAAPIQKAESP